MAFNDKQKLGILATSGLTKEELKNVVSTNALSASQAGATASTSSLGLAVKGLGAKVKELSATIWSFLSTNPVGWIVAIIGSIIAATAAIATINKKIEEHRQKIIEAGETARESIKSAKSELDNLESSAKKAVDTYGKLIDGIDTLNGKNISLSDEEYNEFISASNELAELFPQLVIGLDNEGNKILDLGNNAQDATSKINELIESQRKLVAQQAEEDLIDIFKGISEETRNSNNELKQYQENLDYINRSNPDEFIGALRGFDNNSKSIQLSNNYLSGLDSEIMMNNIASIINDADIIEKELIPQYNEMTEEWFLDLRDITAEDYEKIMNTLYLNEDILREKIIDNISGSISGSKDEINQTYKNELSTIFTALSDDAQYTGLSETNKKLADILISNLDYSEYRDEIQKKYNGNIIDFILNDELFAGLWNASEDEKQEINNIYTNLLAIDPEESLYENTKVIEQYINDLSELLNIDADKLKIMLGYDLSGNEELINRVKEKVTGQSGTDARSVKSGYAAIQREIETLNEEDLILLDRVEIPDDIKRGTVEDFRKFMNNLRKDANINIEISTDITSPLKDIKEAYSSFDDIYDEIINGSTVSADAIDKLNEKFGKINGGESLEKFKEVLTTMPDDIEAQHEALNQLATDYLDQSSLIQNLTVDNAEYTESELKKLGVENAHEVVQSRLIQHNYSEADAKSVLINYSNQLVDAKERERIASLDLENATVGEIATLINEANAAGIDTTALISYLNQKIRATQITLNTEGDINNLSKLCSALGGTVTYLEEYQRVKALLTEGGTIYGNGTADYQYLNGLKQRADEEVRNAFDNAMSANVVYNGSLTSSSGSSSGSSGSSSSPVKDTTKQYNWLEVAITRVQEAISRLNKIESNSFIGWIKRNVALNKEISKVTDNINLQRKAYEYYMSKANSVGLSDEYKQKVKNGAIQIEDITDETLQNQIDQYQEWYDKAIECSDAIQDLNINLSELQKKKFDNIRTEYDSLISLITSKADILDERMNRIEKQGYFVNKDYYEKLIAYENAEINNLKNEYSDLQSSLEEGLSNGLIEEGSEEWSNMKSEILDVEKAIEESTTSLIEYGNALRELNWEIFDYTEDRISSIVDETEFLIDLLSNSNLYDDTGRFNDNGESVNALRAVNYNTYMQQALDYANELKKIESDIDKDPANKDLIERREELLKLQQEAISNAESEKDAIKSLVQDGINIHLDALNSLIDKYKDALNSAKDLYDYQKNIGEQTQEISNFEKIISAYQGDNSEESRKLIQDYQNKLDEAKQNLKETEWDRYISETGDLLDTLYSDYEDVLNARLDDVNALIADMITEANNNSASVKNTIESETEKVGYQITDTMETIFSNNSTIVSSFMDKFTNSSTAIQTAINDIKNLVSQMIVNGNTDIMTNTDVTGAYTKDGWSQSVDGTWTYRENGNLLTNQWIQSNDKWYHLGEDGNMDTDKWIHNESGSWSYVGSNGDALTGWQQLSWNGNTDWYNFDENGTMKEDTWIDDYFLDSSGKMRTSSWIGHNGKYYWVGSDGKWLNLPGWSLDKKPNDGFPIYEYAKGSRYINKDQLAWIAEEGTEIIRTKDGALLQALPQGSTVFTNEMTQRLWDVAKGNLNPFGLSGINIPNIPVGNNDSNNISSVINVTVEANDPDEFARKLGNKLLSNKNFISGIQESTLGQALGRNKLSINKFKM